MHPAKGYTERPIQLHPVPSILLLTAHIFHPSLVLRGASALFSSLRTILHPYPPVIETVVADAEGKHRDRLGDSHHLRARSDKSGLAADIGLKRDIANLHEIESQLHHRGSFEAKTTGSGRSLAAVRARVTLGLEVVDEEKDAVRAVEMASAEEGRVSSILVADETFARRASQEVAEACVRSFAHVAAIASVKSRD